MAKRRKKPSYEKQLALWILGVIAIATLIRIFLPVLLIIFLLALIIFISLKLKILFYCAIS